MNFKSAAELQQFQWQLHHLYGSSGTYGIYDVVYDKLIEDRHKIEFEKTIKDEIWLAARKRFNKDNKRLIQDFKKNKWPEDKLKAHLHKYFKSMLAAKYVLNKLEQDDITLVLMDDVTGKELKPLNIVGYGK